MIHYEIMKRSLYQKIKQSFKDIRLGKYYGYPSCCIYQFVIETFQNKLSGQTRKIKWGKDSFKEFNHVPCDKCMSKIYENNT